MSSDPDHRNKRRLTRYELRDVGRLSVVVTSTDDDSLEGKAIDLSRGGTKVMLASALPINSSVGIRLSAPKKDLDISVSGHVCWVRPHASQKWWVGIAFERDLDDEQFALFAKAGFIERRRDTRYAHDVVAKARWELDSKSVDVRIMDLSAGGVKLLAPYTANVGDRLLIEMNGDSESSILAKVRWTAEDDDGFSLGCAFVNRHSHPQLMKAMGLVPTTRLSRFTPRRLTVRAILGLAMGVATCALGAWLLTQRS